MNARSFAPHLVAIAALASTIAACSSAPTDNVGSEASHLTSAQCASAPAWAENVAYKVGSPVSYSGKVYVCIQAHTSLGGWTPAAVPALWQATDCAGGGTSTGGSSGGNTGGSSSGGTTGGSTGGSTGGTSSGGSSSCASWIYMADAHSCDGHIGSSCGWTSSNEGQGYHCKDMGGWVGCEPGAPACTPSSGGNPPPPPPPPPPTGGGTGGGTGFGAILTESLFNQMFPSHSATYSYAGLVSAAATYSAFGGTGDAAAQKREVAAFLANVAHETGSLQYVEEIVKGDYCQPSAGCPCAPGKQYYGRGAMQLSWNYNYCAAGAALGVALQANPEMVANDPRLAWLTGIWFWMTSTGAGSMTSHNAILQSGFGETIRSINGSIECNGGNPGEVNDRVQYYLRFCSLLGVTPVGNNGC